jgi:hypothetical protein
MSGELMEQVGTEIICVARLDRLRISSWCKRGTFVPKVRGFSVVRDIRLRWHGKPLVYGRLRVLKSNDSATTASWQWDRLKGWAQRWRVTLVADDQQGIAALEAWNFFKHFCFPKLLLFELALDFPPDTGVDADFIRQHALFGKSRFRADRGGPGQLRYGSRFSGKLVRCYQKESVNAYRVEVEMHSSLLPRPRGDKRREVIDTRWPEIVTAGFSILPAHLRFVTFRFEALGRHLRRRFGERGDLVLEQTRARSTQSLHSALAYLRQRGVNNPSRFLRPLMRINNALERAIDEWAIDFLKPRYELEAMNWHRPRKEKKQWVASTPTKKKTSFDR